MPVHITPGPPAGQRPPEKSAPTDTGPPGPASLFAALLLQSGSLIPQSSAEPAGQSAEKTAPETTKKDKKEPLPGTAKNEPEPGKANKQIKAEKSQPSPPPNIVGTAASTKNAMDTFPVSPAPQGERASREQDGELPLSEARTPVSAGLPALPTLLPMLPTPAPSATAVFTAPAPVPAAATLRLPPAVSAVPLPVIAAAPQPAGLRMAKAGIGAPSLPQPSRGLPQISRGTGQLSQSAPAILAARPAAAPLTAAWTMPAAKPSVRVAFALSTPYIAEQVRPSPEKSAMPLAASPLPASLSAAASPKSVAAPEASPEVWKVLSPGTRVSATVGGKISGKISGKNGGQSSTSSMGLLQASRPAIEDKAATTEGEAPPGRVPAQFLLPIHSAEAALPAPTAEKTLQTGGVPADTQTGNKTRELAALDQKPHTPPVPAQSDPARPIKPAEKTVIAESAALPPVLIHPALNDSTKPVAAPLNHAEQAQVVRQVADGVGAAALRLRPATPEQMTIQLHPKDWGRLQVSVTLTAPTGALTPPGRKKPSSRMSWPRPRRSKPRWKARPASCAMRSARQGMNLERLTVSVHIAHADTAAATAGSGSQPQAQAGSSAGQYSQNGQPGGSAFTSAGSQGGRQGHHANPPAFGSPEPEEAAEPLSPRPIGRGQIDTRA